MTTINSGSMDPLDPLLLLIVTVYCGTILLVVVAVVAVLHRLGLPLWSGRMACAVCLTLGARALTWPALEAYYGPSLISYTVTGIVGLLCGLLLPARRPVHVE